jgi:hypothetical protein
MVRQSQGLETQNLPEPQSKEDEDRHRAATAFYIAELSASLATMARNYRLETLAFILEMAHLEAEDATKDL